MSCACGMDSVGTCLVCGVRLCPDHALRGSEQGRLDNRVWAHLDARIRTLGLQVSQTDLYQGTSPRSLNGVRSDLRPLLRYSAQRRSFYNTLRRSGVICGDCRVNGAFEAAGATQPPPAPSLGAGGSQRLRDAVAAIKLGDLVAWDEMASDAALKDALFQDLIYLAREKAERFHIPVEWEAYKHGPVSFKIDTGWGRGKVRATEEVFHVVDIKVPVNREYEDYETRPQYMNRCGQWGCFIRNNQGVLVPSYQPKLVTLKKRGWFSPEERVFRASWSDEPPQPQLDDILKRAAELLAPAA